ncbi:MAG: PilZ domain-containing protein, partial [Acidobacteria bacterium]|nr:PilZ domain-containing protein [Acidobacteriota bacterium]
MPVVAQPSTPPATGSIAAPKPAVERRRYPRYSCRGDVEMIRPGNEPNHVTLLDLSLGGFYVETMSPFSVGTTAAVVITVDKFVIRGEGVVRTSHPAVGNGVAFTKMDEHNWQQLSKLVASLANPGGTEGSTCSEELPVLVEALVQVLETRGILTRAEFLDRLQRITSRR